MYAYDKTKATIDEFQMEVDKTSIYSVSPIDEFIYNGTVVTPLVNEKYFKNHFELAKSVLDKSNPLYITPKYIVESDTLKDKTNVYVVGEDCTYKGIPVSFYVKDIKDKLYFVQDISHQGEGKEPYYLLSNLEGDTKILYKHNFKNEFNLQDTLLFL